MQTYAYGFPRLGENREFKRAIESFWSKQISEQELKDRIKKLEEDILITYEQYVDKFPVGEMTLYDNMLDTAAMLGVYDCGGLDKYYDLCRGKNALEMTKWFNTNYHYLVPVLNSANFRAAWNKPAEKKDLFKKGIPYFIGPWTFLKLCKNTKKENTRNLLLSLADAYFQLIKDFEEVHFDEPAFVMELSQEEISFIKEAYKKFENLNTKIYLFTYYDSVDFLKDLYELPLKGIGLDFVNGKENLENIKKCGFPEDKLLIAGVVNGRNIWRTNIQNTVALTKQLSLYAKNIAISNAGPLYHLPLSTEGENLNEKLLKKVSFAKERLQELKLIDEACKGDLTAAENWNENIDFGVNETIKKKVADLKDEDFVKLIPYEQRLEKQKEILGLPLFPTTTIGSFPQDKEIRKKRADFRKGRLSQEEYGKFVEFKIDNLIKLQEDLGLDVFVHGEFERTDMVEFFAQKLDGIASTENGWIISYGTRVYRPPIIYGDVSRPQPITLAEINFAQSLTKKPLKGMLTGPVTIIAWSFVRDNIPLSDVAYQISLCLRSEIEDYEKSSIKIVQIDEPAFRERAPLKKRDWDKYFNWAVKSFNLASQSKPETQIHTHMCYSEFGEIIEHIIKMDFDVITIEAARSKGGIVEDFQRVDFKKQIGLGVWDIHSPLVPECGDMKKIIQRALEILPKENFWINPDCGLKTRQMEEVAKGLKNMIEVAKKFRETDAVFSGQKN